MAGRIHVGTSGWHYKHWVGPFYPERWPASRMLEFYCRHFDTVELNNSFYKLPTFAAMEVWRESTPNDFLFAVKGSRFITHNKKLKDPENALNNILPRADVLGKKLGPILWQLPPKWRVNLDRLEEFLSALPRYHRYAFELREPSWLIEPVYRLLSRFNAGLCIYDLAQFHSPIIVTADFTYVRLHGPAVHKYAGSYSPAALRAWAGRLRNWARAGLDSYVYFDNDQAAFAAKNALTLRRLVTGIDKEISSAA
jgi:uncharacterized protein YecE (DUF72 family)